MPFHLSMMKTLRWTAVVLLLAIGAIHEYYGAFVANSYGNVYGYSHSMWFYMMGLIYCMGAAAIAANFKPNIFGTLAAIYAALLIGIYFCLGSFDTIGYVDKAIEVILMINLAMLQFRQPKHSPP
jgi:peptidoglycan/LPS O-acetylase OafA/YrhL